MNRQKSDIIIVLAASLIISLLNSPLFPVFFDDTEIFRYIGLVMKNGGTIYVDVFDHKPPLIYFFNFIKVQFGVWAFWTIDMLLVLFASVKFLRINQQYKLLYAFVLPVLFNLILRHPGFSMGFGMTREYTTTFLLLAFCALITNKKWSAVFIGFLGPAIFFMQQDQIVLFLPLVGYLFYLAGKEGYKNLLQVTLKVLYGGLIIPICLLAYLLFHNALVAFWQDAFLFNFSWYSEKPNFFKTLITIKNYLVSFDLLNAFLITSLICLASFIAGSYRKVLLVLSISLLFLSFISEYTSSALTNHIADVWYYFLPLAATLPIALFVAFAFTKKDKLKHPVYQAIIYVSLLFSPLLSTAVRISNYNKYPQNFIATSGEMQYLRKQNIKDYDLYVINNSNYIYAYNEFNVLAPSLWIYHYFWSWYKNWDADHTKLNGIISSLQTHQTKYIIDDTYERNFGSEENKNLWHHYLETYFQKMPGLKIWVRKP